eukprot:c823_g1_i1.p1 GENE.c823_g1_i1~~c823_g1_i1.p1  ORF type:complete len:681 (+),score=196.51 c823_g1_i1:54-2045(+)
MTDGEWLHIHTPGRVCLFGEHSDWSGGFRRFNPDIVPGCTIVVGTNQGLFARVRRHNSSLILSSVDEHGKVLGPIEIPMRADALLAEARKGEFWSYVCGVAYKLLTDFRVSGLEIHNYKTTLPLKKGLSSSAAICVMTVRAFSRVYDLKMTVRGEMEYAYQGEILTPSRCGRMDQACAFGSRPVSMTYDGEFVDAHAIAVAKPIHLVVVDLCAAKDTVIILKELQDGFPFARTDVHKGMHALLGSVNSNITARAEKALEAGNAELLGALMNEAMSEFDKYAGAACPSQLTAPVLHKTLTHPLITPLVYGGKGVGAGGDGTAQFVCKGPKEQNQLQEVITNLGMFAMPLTIEAMSPVRKAVVTAAGFGSELFPASKAVKPELFPIMDHDNVSKPAILINIEQILAAGIEEVLVVVQQDDVPAFENLFHRNVSPQNFHKLSPESQRAAEQMIEVGKRVKLVVQSTQEGLGDAVLCARDFVGEEPFLLVLGDHLYKTTNADGKTCAEQVLGAYQESGTSVIGLQVSTVESVSSFGVATGTWAATTAVEGSSKNGKLPNLLINEVCEKPSPEHAERALKVPQLSGKQLGGDFMTVFGMYVLDARVFGLLQDDVSANRRYLGLFQLTPSLATLAKEKSLVGVVVQGIRYDLGTTQHLVQAMNEFHKRL